jgi:hypothetical protein
MVHSGSRSGARPELTGRCHTAPKLATRAPMARGGCREPQRQNGGWRGGLTQPGNDETKQWWTKLSATANGAWRRGEKESAS